MLVAVVKDVVRLKFLQNLNVSVIEAIADILARGVAEGAYKCQADPIDVHMLISAFCFFCVPNRYTFGTIFRRDLSEPETMTRHKGLIADAVIHYLKG